jgi:hypothetical protein
MDTRIMDSSKNEVFIAIFLGILVGLVSVLSFYYIFKQKGSFQQNSDKISVDLNAQNAGSDKQNRPIAEAFEITIEPQESEIISQIPEFKINGKTHKDAALIIQTDALSKFITPDSNGEFSYTVTLKNDITQLFISAIYKGQEKSVEKTIYYEKKL